MKTIGLIGGTGWLSTIDYYYLINKGINKHLGGYHSARCILYSLNFGDIVACNERKDTEGVYTLIKDASERVINAGAECIVLCANTLHKFAPRLQKKIGFPIIHIAEATAREINNNNLTSVGLLGTKYTMEEDFYVSILKDANIHSIIPDKKDREFIHKTIYDELIKQDFQDSSRQKFLKIIEKLQRQGAEGIILGCTEIPLIIHNDDCSLTLFNTTQIHAQAAVDFALGK